MADENFKLQCSELTPYDFAYARRVVELLDQENPFIASYWCYLHSGLTALLERLAEPDYNPAVVDGRLPITADEAHLLLRANLVSRQTDAEFSPCQRTPSNSDLMLSSGTKLIESIEEDAGGEKRKLFVEPLAALQALAQKLMTAMRHNADSTNNQVTECLKLLTVRSNEFQPFEYVWADVEQFLQIVENQSLRRPTHDAQLIDNAGDPVTARDLAPHLRKFSRRHRELYAFIHNGLTEVVVLGEDDNNGGLCGRIDELGYLTESGRQNLLTQVENAKLISEVLKRDALAWNFELGYDEVNRQAEALHGLLTNRGEDFPPLRALRLLAQALEILTGAEIATIPENLQFGNIPKRLIAPVMYARTIFSAPEMMPVSIPCVKRLLTDPNEFWRRMCMSLSRSGIGELGLSMSRVLLEFEMLAQAPKTEAAFIRAMMFVMPSDYQKMADAVFPLRSFSRYFLRSHSEIAAFCLNDESANDERPTDESRHATSEFHRAVVTALNEWQGNEGARLRYALCSLGEIATILASVPLDDRADLDDLLRSAEGVGGLEETRYAEKVFSDLGAVLNPIVESEKALRHDDNDLPYMQASEKVRLSGLLADWADDDSNE